MPAAESSTPPLVVLVAASSVLAVVQRSQALAIFSMSGGFLAPVLTSTGEGSHVALFSYYALLNTGILGMAWFRHWRWLNWVGFVFTFAIGALWGYEYYEPRHFATTQPFLVLFFLYLGHIALFRAFDDPTRGARAAAILALVGFVNVPIVYFSVRWWRTLHQVQSSPETVDPAMVWPLRAMMLAFLFLFVFMLTRRYVLARLRGEEEMDMVRMEVAGG